MFGISISEWLLISVIAMVIFGPEQLLVIARKLGTTLGKLRNFTDSLKQQVYDSEHLNLIKELHNELQTTLQHVNKYGANTEQNLESSYLMTNQLETNSAEQYFYQPELDFSRQPELFDNEWA